jgi:hypothetical protein
VSDWDEDSEQLRANLRRVLSDIRQDALRRVKPTVEAARVWHGNTIHRLTTPSPEQVGRFRGEPGLEGCEVTIGDYHGVSANQVAQELKAFEERLRKTTDLLDQRIQPGRDMSADHVAAVIDLCAWVHSEWVRIHPFANGNGRTARLWANCIAMRYDLPPFVRLRPRPNSGYGAAAEAAMVGQWESTARVYRHMYREVIRR